MDTKDCLQFEGAYLSTIDELVERAYEEGKILSNFFAPIRKKKGVEFTEAEERHILLIWAICFKDSIRNE